ncbi:MAG: RnfABCDGE type electron transport complex subunit D [Candidatus Omnitrophota bacterium]|nr:RnfABCDGE type electron transport complex subunit D [Candidatus Omnitrophota bacterium]MBU1929398.1 RnfABCDGE type electron transport complex subunit D [Candidatus Omnitrophota bacterium]MBU2034862.1 RnfABCDGE type electron transport complex subunit D [Candidatus Omnitrophota bacterium]MBU2221082.1 RnfABCDGE type electron transport complex subunit D [Candidatus Omnitrophota bacterium]
MQNKLIVSSSPHIHTRESTRRIMWLVIISLIPAGLSGIYIFGLSALRTIMLGITSALISELLLQILFKRKNTILDGSAFLTGLLLSYNLPANTPFWLPIAGSFFAIAIGKFVFGGLGQNIFNPALAGRAFLVASWPKYMTAFTLPAYAKGWLNYDAITQATPLALIKKGKALIDTTYLDLFLGNKSGCIGEVCILALILGAAFLFLKGYISWHIPFPYIITVGLLAYIFGPKGYFSGDWLSHILSGGLILGAFFMATDYVTSPLTRKGQVFFGIGCGLITIVIRLWGGTSEGVCYSILMMNAAAPIIDRYTKSRIYGTR